MKRAGQSFNGSFVLSTLVVVSLSFLERCRPAPPQNANFWSVKTAEDYSKLLLKGRSVNPVPKSDVTSKNSGSFGGVSTVIMQMDASNQAAVLVQFSPQTTPAVAWSDLLTYSLDFISKVAGDLHVQVSEYKSGVLSSARSDQVVVLLNRFISGTPVRGAKIQLIFTQSSDGYHLIELKNQSWGHALIDLKSSGAMLDDTKIAQVIGDASAKIAKTKDEYLVNKATNPPRLTPVTTYEVSVSDGRAFALSFASGADPKLMEAMSHQVDVVLESSVFQRGWPSAKAYFPLSDVQISGASQSTDSAGNLPDGVTTGTIQLSSKWAVISSQSGGAPNYSIANENGHMIAKSPGGSGDGPLNSYVAIDRVRKYVMQFYQPNEVSYFKSKLRVTTDMPKSCNAYYQDTTLNFFSEGKGCANMALVNDVIYHEWGHGLDDYTGPGSDQDTGITDSAFSEGIGDVVAMFMNKDSMMGTGFYTSDGKKPIRNLENNKIFQQGAEDEMHAQGTIIGGAFWELRKRMVNKYGDIGHDKAAKLFFRHLLEAASYEDSYDIVQRIADDDHNPATKHPDWCLINHAFATKGLVKKDSCSDDDSNQSPGPELSVFFALGDSAVGSNQQIYVSAAISGAKSVNLCLGSTLCSQPIVMPLMNSTQNVSIFGPVSMEIKDGQRLNAQILDQSNQELARRVVKFTKK